jgi:hypothetical protein
MDALREVLSRKKHSGAVCETDEWKVGAGCCWGQANRTRYQLIGRIRVVKACARGVWLRAGKQRTMFRQPRCHNGVASTTRRAEQDKVVVEN